MTALEGAARRVLERLRSRMEEELKASLDKLRRERERIEAEFKSRVDSVLRELEASLRGSGRGA